MPVAINRSDIERIVAQRSEPNLRTLIVCDHNSLLKSLHKAVVYGAFQHPYDTAPNHDSIVQLFDATLRLLTTTDTVVFDATTLPIVTALGRYDCTLLERHGDEIMILDGDRVPVDNYLGLE